jgi:hypothetical protein
VSDFGDLLCSVGKVDAARCTNPPTTRVTVGCVHEHIRPGEPCDEHLQAILAGDTHCYDCYYGDDSHLCALLGRVMV